MRYYKGYIALSETCDVPVLLHVRNARALCFDQLRELLSHEMLAVIVRSREERGSRSSRVGMPSTRLMMRNVSISAGMVAISTRTSRP